MKTIILEEPGRFAVSDTPEPARPGPGQVLVRVRNVGVCGTDYHAFRGRQPFFQYPRILGHELAVEVIEAGAEVTGIAPGALCAVNPYLHCGACSACRRGKTNCCASLKVLGVHVDGGMRERVLLPATHLYPSTALSLAQLTLVETLGIGAHAVMRSAVTRGEAVLVIGAGPIGLSVIEFLRVEGAVIQVLELNPRRREFCERKYDITCSESAEQVLAGELPTLVFDCTGNKDSMMGAFRFVANGGKLVYVGLFQGEVTFADPEFHRKEITLLASRNCTAPEHARIIQLIEAGSIDTEPWISERAPAESLLDRFPVWLQPESGIVKAIVEW